ncbi:MAG: peptidylprolyl isomerase [Bacillota bacterium]
MKSGSGASRKKRVLAFMIICAFVLGVVGVAAVAILPEVSFGSVMVTVNQTRITRRDVDRWMGILKIIYGDHIDTPEVRSSIIDQLIEEALLLEAAGERGVVPDPASVDTAVSEITEALKDRAGGAEELERVMKRYRVGVDDLVYLATRARTLEDLYAIVVAGVGVSEDEVREYYETHRSDFAMPEMVRARHIMLDTEEKAKEILALLEAGEEFAALAAGYSMDTYSAMNGGDLGFFGRGDMAQEFEDVAFTLGIGEISGIVQTFLGYHIILVEERTEARELGFDEVAEDIKLYLDRQNEELAYQSFLADLRQRARIETKGR